MRFHRARICGAISEDVGHDHAAEVPTLSEPFAAPNGVVVLDLVGGARVQADKLDKRF